LASNDPNADHPTGHAAQDGLCPEACNDPSFTPDWNDKEGLRCEWPCAPDRTKRGYEALTVGMKEKNPGIQALISVGGWNFNDCKVNAYGQGAPTCEIFSEIAASEAKTRLFAKNVIDFCRKWGFDGFDLDWEYPVVAGHNDKDDLQRETTEDYANYISMLRIMKEEFMSENPTKPLLLTAAVGVGKATADTAYDIPEMSKHLDLINLMTYDLHGAWESRTGCNANLYATAEDTALGGGVGSGEAVEGYPLSVSWAVDYWLGKGAPPSKLTIGLATYGRGWTLKDATVNGYNAPASGAAAAGEATGEKGYRSFYEVQELLKSGATAFYDEERECPYVVSGNEWIGYDNERSLCAKLAFARDRKLRGSMVWALDLDDFKGEYSEDGVGYPLIRLASTAGRTCGNTPTAAATTSNSVQASTTSTPESTTVTTEAPKSTTPSLTSTAVPSQSTSMETTETSTTTQPVSTTFSETSGVTCFAAPGSATRGASDAVCTATCKLVLERWPAGKWPCAEGGPCTCAVATTTAATGSTSRTISEVTTSAPASTTASNSGSCVRNLDCDENDWCNDAGYDAYCANMGKLGECGPFPQCVLA